LVEDRPACPPTWYVDCAELWCAVVPQPDVRQSVPEPQNQRDERRRSGSAERGWLVRCLAVVLALLGLGLTNIYVRATWHEVEDGVLWVSRPDGVTAAELADRARPLQPVCSAETCCFAIEAVPSRARPTSSCRARADERHR